MQSKQDKENTKTPYEKPRLRAIELAAEEVLGIGCKLESGGFAPAGPTCISNNCTQAGS